MSIQWTASCANDGLQNLRSILVRLVVHDTSSLIIQGMTCPLPFQGRLYGSRSFSRSFQPMKDGCVSGVSPQLPPKRRDRIFRPPPKASCFLVDNPQISRGSYFLAGLLSGGATRGQHKYPKAKRPFQPDKSFRILAHESCLLPKHQRPAACSATFQGWS